MKYFRLSSHTPLTLTRMRHVVHSTTHQSIPNTTSTSSLSSLAALDTRSTSRFCRAADTRYQPRYNAVTPMDARNTEFFLLPRLNLPRKNPRWAACDHKCTQTQTQAQNTGAEVRETALRSERWREASASAANPPRAFLPSHAPVPAAARTRAGFYRRQPPISASQRSWRSATGS